MREIEEKAEKSKKDKRKKKERKEKDATVRKFELFVEIFSRTKKLKTVLTDSSFSSITSSHFERQDLFPLLPASSFISSVSLTL